MLSIEHGRAAYWADFAFYALALLAVAGLLCHLGAWDRWLLLVTLMLTGLGIWTFLEYVIHRFLFHGFRPFSCWHEEHHLRPIALISTPTLLSASLIATLLFLPAALVGGLGVACALTLGFLVGYLGYAGTHHAVHHWRADSAWLRRRKQWHGLHHRGQPPRCFGVTTTFWDHVFRSAR